MAATVALRSSTSWSAYQPAGLTYQASRPSSDRRYVFDSGGRPNGARGFRLMSTTRPGEPSFRRGGAAVPPSLPLPLVPIRVLVDRLATRYILPPAPLRDDPPGEDLCAIEPGDRLRRTNAAAAYTYCTWA